MDGLEKKFTFKFKVKSVTGSGDIKLKIGVKKFGEHQSRYLKEEVFNFDGNSNEDVEVAVSTAFNDGDKQWEVFAIATIDSTINQYTPKATVIKTTSVRANNVAAIPVITIKSNVFMHSEDTASQSLSNLDIINPQLLMPDMKIIDFLSDIFKTYNLVVFEERVKR